MAYPADADFSGKLSFLNLGEILQLLGGSGASGTLKLFSEFAPAPGVIHVDNGNPVNAGNGSLSGLEALFSLFGWTEGRFEFSTGDISCERAIKKGRMEIILDGLRLLDEGRIEKLGAPAALGSAPAAPAPAAEPVKRADQPPTIKGPLVDYSCIVDEETFYDGDEIVREGAHGNWIWVVLEGAAEIIKTTSAGSFRLLRIGDGAFLGSVASLLVGDNVRNTTVVASGNIQLGMVDSQQLSAEIAALSGDYKSLIKSLDNRLRSATDIAADIHAREGAFMAAIKDKRIAVREGQSEERLFRIREGEVVVARGTERGYLPLAVLKKGDYFGHIPFLTLGHEPHAAAVFSSADLKLVTVNTRNVESEHRRLSSTLSHIIEHLAACISATTLVTMNLYNRSGLA
ncbi:MAG: cyclic nucleotide-binding domain-containing protein [Desulfobacterales bacterium]|jgi:CRP-like cAMP-binding protein|nr:cyclic nucleotide-binding domain-containing protein [Desulfobacterales bacterium]